MFLKSDWKLNRSKSHLAGWILDSDEEDGDDRICRRFPSIAVAAAAVGGCSQRDTWPTMQCNTLQGIRFPRNAVRQSEVECNVTQFDSDGGRRERLLGVSLHLLLTELCCCCCCAYLVFSDALCCCKSYIGLQCRGLTLILQLARNKLAPDGLQSTTLHCSLPFLVS